MIVILCACATKRIIHRACTGKLKRKFNGCVRDLHISLLFHNSIPMHLCMICIATWSACIIQKALLVSHSSTKTNLILRTFFFYARKKKFGIKTPHSYVCSALSLFRIAWNFQRNSNSSLGAETIGGCKSVSIVEYFNIVLLHFRASFPFFQCAYLI